MNSLIDARALTEVDHHLLYSASTGLHNYHRSWASAGLIGLFLSLTGDAGKDNDRP